ncbi:MULTISPECIES: alpha/beta fold hydrolase [Pseudonocardia]|uniref:Ndr family protein n=2 Tax=Pseudonocardia TaxID=1847 RepID=A0ABQ0S4V0_9PSEU|nr:MULTISPECIES: alpha/beta fold hydrolase [Pseudonocardia]OSY43970.1 putative carboxylesterase nap [Pseudonocardia autotrophica]TDN74297.1 pimeloyl-ACP methyl ester carboxylesterase [Pseudonocardia autotrophica]BBG05061.1 Ndr family protein [Pseudonocardia autotrophica]GEC27950.1 Ndr family protein [Pseudonocardia saturnea]
MGGTSATTGIYHSEAGATVVRERYEQQLDAWPVPVQRYRIATGHGTTAVLTCGDPTGSPLVLLHGSGANSAVWRDGVELLAATRRVLLVDLLGEPGLSDPVRLDLTTPATADWLAGILDEFEIGATDIAGISLGGWTATDFATRHPGRVNRLALVCPAGIGDQTFRKVAPAFLLSAFGSRGRRRSAEIVTGLDGHEHPEVLDEICLLFEHFRPRTARFPLFDDAALSRLTMPMLALLGERDRVFDPVRTRERLVRLCPDARVELVPGAGHAVLGQVPRIVRFLDEP